MVIHLAEQTRVSSMNETLIQRLNKVAANPFKNYAVLYQSLQQTTEKIDTTPGNYNNNNNIVRSKRKFR